MKNKVYNSIFAAGLFLVPFLVSAQQLTGSDSIGAAMKATLGFIDGVVIPVILSIGFLVFVWGMFQYFIRGGANDEAKENGRSLIMYAIAGFVVILSFWGIVILLSNSLGLEGQSLNNVPTANTIGN